MMYPRPGNVVNLTSAPLNNHHKIVIPGLVSPTDSQKTINSHLTSATTTTTSSDPAVLLAQQTIQTISSASNFKKQPQITIIQPRTTPAPLIMPRPTTGKNMNMCISQSIFYCIVFVLTVSHFHSNPIHCVSSNLRVHTSQDAKLIYFQYCW